MVERREVAFDDPVNRLLPQVTLPARDGRAITLADLATHTSGLPRLPGNLDGSSLENAFFLKAVDAQLTFTRDAGGVVTGLLLHQNGVSQAAPRRP